MSGIYIHIPFCHAKCAYCDFFSTPRHTDYQAYIRALFDEYEARRHELTDPVNTVYIGGGTPSSLPLPQLSQLIDKFAELRPSEFTIEVNPEDVTPQLAQLLADSGINRVSMGVQSFIDTELAFIGRRHSASDAVNAVKTLRRAGIGNLSLDLIYGLPLQTLQSWQTSLDAIINLHPQHISAYALSYEPGTRLWAMRRAGKVTEASDTLYAQCYETLCRSLADSGYLHYEIANFALPEYHSLHNSSYWDFTPYLGLGIGAHSFDGSIRRHNPAGAISRYLHSPTTYTIDQPETPAERHNDYVMVALRTARGIDLTLMHHLFGPEASQRAVSIAAPMLADGRLIATDSGFRVAESQWLVSDALILEFLE